MVFMGLLRILLQKSPAAVEDRGQCSVQPQPQAAAELRRRTDGRISALILLDGDASGRGGCFCLRQ